MVPLSLASSPAGVAGFTRRQTGIDWPRNVTQRTTAEVRAVAALTLLLVVAGVALGLTNVRLRARVRELRYDGLATRQIIQRLELEERTLLAQAEKLGSDERIEQVAAERLGMTRPAKGQIAVLP